LTTIRDIAAESGFSVSTVSRVLAGHPDVSPSTAAAIQAVIARRHFAVNRNASNLKRSGTTTILVVVKGRYNMLFAAMLEHVQTAITASGHTAVTQYIDEDDNEVAEAEHLVAEIKPRGVVFLGGDAANMITDADRIGPECPAVVLTNSVSLAGRPGVSSITTDDRAAARLAADYLLDNGHRRIGVIGGIPERSIISRHRQEGVIAAMGVRGVPFDVHTQYAGTRFSLECGYEATFQLLDDVPDVTAIYAMSDIMALGALRALHERGLDVPGDISLIGHDGIELASYVVPKLVTIRQPQEVMASRGIEILMGHLAGNSDPVEEFEPVTVVEGESVKPIG